MEDGRVSDLVLVFNRRDRVVALEFCIARDIVGGVAVLPVPSRESFAKGKFEISLEEIKFPLMPVGLLLSFGSKPSCRASCSRCKPPWIVRFFSAFLAASKSSFCIQSSLFDPWQDGLEDVGLVEPERLLDGTLLVCIAVVQLL